MDDYNTTPQNRPRTQVVTTLRVEVIEGPDRGTYATSTETLSVGTAADNGLVIGDPTISRYHIEAAVQPGGIAVTDLGSTNGSFIGTTRIERAIVAPGTLLKLGGTTIRIDDAGRHAIVVQAGARELVGMRAQSAQMHRLFADIERIARTATSVLVVGESGTGKERVAEAVHALSPRAAEPFVTIDCGALPSALLASELFGHERGAFTGADRTYVGAFERAAGGTVFLDEIGELPATDQVALLGVLERRRFRRVGGRNDIELGARIVAATNRDLRGDVNHARFRHDLYHRLAVIVLRTPPLRDRPEDIPALVELFAREFGAEGPAEQVFGVESLARWQRHPWPGNVRELRNAVEAALVVGNVAEEIGTVPAADGAIEPYKLARARAVDDFERPYLTRLVESAGGNMSRAARIARMDRSYLMELLRRHELKR